MKTIFVFMQISVSFHTGLNDIFPPKEFGFIQFTNGMVLSECETIQLFVISLPVHPKP